MTVAFAMTGCPTDDNGGGGGGGPYTVTFDGNGATSGTPPGALTEASAGVGITIPGHNDLAKGGEVFVGWNANSSGTGQTYQQGTTFKPTKNTTLYAKWEPPTTHTVTFKVPGGADVLVENVLSGAHVPAASFPAGYTIGTTTNSNNEVFSGWFVADASGNATDVQFIADSTPVTGDLTIVTKWVSADTEYTVTFKAEGSADITATIKVGLVVTPWPADPTPPANKAFVGWFIADSEGEATDTEFVSTTPVAADTTLVAVWINTYTVSFYANGQGQGQGPEKTVTVREGASVALADFPADPVVANFLFGGWYIIESGSLSTTEFTPTFVVTSNLSIGPKLIPLYTVTFNLLSTSTTPYATVTGIVEGETIDSDDWPEDPDQDSLGSDDPSPAVEKTFVGWFLADGTTEFTATSPVTADTTVIAKFVQTFTVTFEGIDGASDVVVKVAEGKTVTTTDWPVNPLPADLEKAFDSWIIKDSSPEVAFTRASVVTENTVVTAKLVAAFKVSFEDGSGTEIKVVGRILSGEVLRRGFFPANPTKPSFKFVRWVVKGVTPASEFDWTTPITASIVVEVEWVAAFNITFVPWTGEQVSATYQIAADETFAEAGYAAPKKPNRGNSWMFYRWEDTNGNAFADSGENASTFLADTEFTGKWYNGEFGGDTTDALEKVYLEDQAWVLYEFDLSAYKSAGADGGKIGDTALIDVIKAIKGIKASYGVSEAAAEAGGGPRERVVGPYFFNGSEAITLDKELANNAIGSKFWGDFKVDPNGKPTARLDGTGSLPNTFNKWHPYMIASIGSDGWSEFGGSKPAKDTWVNKTYTFPTTAPNDPPVQGNPWSYANTMALLDDILKTGKYSDDTQVLPASTDLTKIYFGIGLLRANAGSAVNSTDSIWDHGRVFLVKDVKLLLPGAEEGDPDIEISAAIPNLTIPTGGAEGASVTSNQIFASYINPVVGSWRGTPEAEIITDNAPGWEPPKWDAAVKAFDDYSVPNGPWQTPIWTDQNSGPMWITLDFPVQGDDQLDIRSFSSYTVHAEFYTANGEKVDAADGMGYFRFRQGEAGDTNYGSNIGGGQWNLEVQTVRTTIAQNILDGGPTVRWIGVQNGGNHENGYILVTEVTFHP